MKNYSVYGRRKLRKAAARRATRSAATNVARLMAQMGIRGASRAKKRFTTRSDPGACERPISSGATFTATAPNEKWVADFTYASTWSGVVYVAFVVDVFSRRIVGWKAARTMATSLVLDALNMTAWVRRGVDLDGGHLPLRRRHPCEPRSLWWMRPSASRVVRESAMTRASTTSSASACSPIAQPTRPLWHRSRMPARWSLVGNSQMSATQRWLGSGDGEVALEQIGGRSDVGAARPPLLAGMHAHQAFRPHEPCHAFAPDSMTPASELTVHSRHPVGPQAVLVDLADVGQQRLVGDRTRRGRARPPGVEPRAGHLGQRAQPLHRVTVSMVLDEAEAAHRIVSRAK